MNNILGKLLTGIFLLIISIFVLFGVAKKYNVNIPFIEKLNIINAQNETNQIPNQNNLDTQSVDMNYSYSMTDSGPVYSTDEADATINSVDTNNIQGHIISINTNANGVTFVKIKDDSINTQHTLYTLLPNSELDLQKGDLISFPSTLNKSNNGNYYIVENTEQYKVLERTGIEDSQQQLALHQINPSMQGQNVLTQGMIKNLYISQKGHVFFTIYDNNMAEIKGVIFKAENDQLPARLALIQKYNNTNDVLFFEGQIDIYKGELEIIVKKVRK